MALSIQRVRDLPADVDRLVAQASQQDFPALVRLREEWALGENRFQAPGECLFVARLHGRLVGLCGLNRDPFVAQGASVGRVRRLYVDTACRRAGVGRALVAAVHEAARGRFEVLHLRTFDAEASAFYVALGFEPVAGDLHATHQRRCEAPPPTKPRPPGSRDD